MFTIIKEKKINSEKAKSFGRKRSEKAFSCVQQTKHLREVQQSEPGAH